MVVLPVRSDGKGNEGEGVVAGRVVEVTTEKRRVGECRGRDGRENHYRGATWKGK